MSTEAVETNTNTPNPAALVPVVVREAIVRPATSVEDVLAVSAAYHELYTRLLDATDFQTISSKKFVKKSGWRKLALAFNVTTEIVSRDYERADTGRIVRAEVVARASAANGRFADGLGAADLYERCCPVTCYKRHTHCPAQTGSVCDGARHFSNPQHDIPATAATRATNRACSDLFGMGEVSAEEMDAAREAAAESTSDYDAKERLDPWLREADLSQEELAELRAWRQEVELPAPSQMSMSDVEATLVRIGMIVGGRAVDRAAPRAATPDEAAADDAQLFEGTATETPQPTAEFDLEGVDANDGTQTEMTWAERDFEERTRPGASPFSPTDPASSTSTPSTTDPSTTTGPAPATSDEPVNLVQRGRAIHFHRKAGAAGLQKDVQDAIMLLASQGRTTHATKLTEPEMQVAETLLEQLVAGSQDASTVLAAARETMGGSGGVRS